MSPEMLQKLQETEEIFEMQVVVGWKDTQENTTCSSLVHGETEELIEAVLLQCHLFGSAAGFSSGYSPLFTSASCWGSPVFACAVHLLLDSAVKQVGCVSCVRTQGYFVMVGVFIFFRSLF